MIDEKEQIMKTLQEKIEMLPKEMQNAVCWIIKHIELVEQITDGEKMADVKVEKYLKMAKEKEDYIMWALVAYKRSKDQKETEVSQQENGSSKL